MGVYQEVSQVAMPSFGQVIVCGKNRYFSQAAFSLVRETGVTDPVEAVQCLTNGLLELVEANKPPMNLAMVASFQGAVITRTDIRESGRLVPLGAKGYRIEVRDSDPAGRQNFSIGHEIGHTLIPSYAQSPTVKSDMLTGEFQKRNEEEFFCDIASRNLLLPEAIFKEHCSRITPSIGGLLELSSIFQASIEAIELRLDQLRCWNCIPVVWELALKPSQKRSEAQMALLAFEELSEPIEEYRVKFHAGDDAALFFPIARHIPMDSDMVSGCLSCGEFKGRCIIPTSKRDVECDVEAVVVPYRNEHGNTKQRIVSLIYP